MRFFEKLRQGYFRLMADRYGTDSLNRAITVFWLVLAILNLFLHSFVVYCLELILCVTVFFRMLSKNRVKRTRENYRWYQMTQGIQKGIRRTTVRIRDRKTMRFFRCPYCKAPIRMPKKVGRFNIRCNACQKTFQKEFKK